MIEIKINKDTIEKYFVTGFLTQTLSELALIAAKLFSDIQKTSDNKITYDFLVKQLNKILIDNKEMILDEMSNKKENSDASV